MPTHALNNDLETFIFITRFRQHSWADSELFEPDCADLLPRHCVPLLPAILVSTTSFFIRILMATPQVPNWDRLPLSGPRSPTLPSSAQLSHVQLFTDQSEDEREECFTKCWVRRWFIIMAIPKSGLQPGLWVQKSASKYTVHKAHTHTQAHIPTCSNTWAHPFFMFVPAEKAQVFKKAKLRHLRRS